MELEAGQRIMYFKGNTRFTGRITQITGAYIDRDLRTGAVEYIDLLEVLSDYGDIDEITTHDVTGKIL